MSLTPVTVTTWSAFQFSVVKTRYDPLELSVSALTVASPVSVELTGIDTVDEGWLVSFTVKVAVDPDSLTDPLDADIKNPAVPSLSIL